MRNELFEADSIFENTTEDIFPYIESTIDILDDNLNWWKENYNKLEDDIRDAIKAKEEDTDIKVRFIIFNGRSEEDIVWHGPAIEYKMSVPEEIVEHVKESMGETWNGHKVIHVNNKLIVMFE